MEADLGSIELDNDLFHEVSIQGQASCEFLRSSNQSAFIFGVNDAW